MRYKSTIRAQLQLSHYNTTHVLFFLDNFNIFCYTKIKISVNGGYEMDEERTLISFDWALKSILRQKDNFDILEGFLSDLLKEKITIIDLLESESNKQYETDKSNRVDLRAKDSKGREIIIEVQHKPEADYMERIHYGAMEAALESISAGDSYANVKKVISVSIVYWKLLEKKYLIKKTSKYLDLTNSMEGKEIFIKESNDISAEYYFIQPEWFNDNIKSKIDEWVYFFKHSEVKGSVKATNMDKLQDKLDLVKMSEKERGEYKAYMKSKVISEGMIKYALDEERQKMINAMKKSGMSDKAIEKIIELSKSGEENHQ